MHDLRGLVDFAAETAYLAGRRSLAYFGPAVEFELKDDATPVTVADREVERLMRERIESRFPDHDIVGEEFEAKQRASSHCWYIDPIDGTKAFMRGVPLYAVLLALEIEGRIEVGAACFPALDELVAAATGLGCRLNGRPTHVSAAERLDQGIVAFTDVGSFSKSGREGAFARLCSAAYDRRGWSDAYGHALVATGRAEVMCDPVLSSWDAAPFGVILREAGGYFGDWSGTETVHGGEGLSTTRQLLPEVLALIEGDQGDSH